MLNMGYNVIENIHWTHTFKCDIGLLSPFHNCAYTSFDSLHHIATHERDLNYVDEFVLSRHLLLLLLLVMLMFFFLIFLVTITIVFFTNYWH